MFGGDLPVMHQSRKWRRKMEGRPFTQRFHGCIRNIKFMCARIVKKHVDSATAEKKAVHFMNIRCK
ncbi:hypothetical protein BSK65_19505 [Paenibacillus odorifer]|uniref:Uncharacterized protein n=1 Tax=Paenibacillus odorifer TaxID=189426 RepID=A0A1R0ZDP7_9BACL|nr:hypothetical protein H70737_27065 [Paenibacillus sp. FSL H7-0737]OME67720.1 hypothetical protein BSK65_19505 [Paenibacillus odorifer]